MLIIIISRSSLKLGHVGSKTRSLGQQATQVSDLGPFRALMALLFFFAGGHVIAGVPLFRKLNHNFMYKISRKIYEPGL